MSSYEKLSPEQPSSPSADGSEEPVSEFLFDNFVHHDLQNHRNAMNIARNASIPAAPPTIAAYGFDMR